MPRNTCPPCRPTARGTSSLIGQRRTQQAKRLRARRRTNDSGQAPLTGQPRLWTSHSTGPGMANSALADGHARQLLLAQSPCQERALADGHARGSRANSCWPSCPSARGWTRERLQGKLMLVFLLERSRMDTREAPGQTLLAQAFLPERSRMNTREAQKAHLCWPSP